MEDLSNAKFIALTTDGWTSRATQSFMTHYITDNWVIKNPVLQTRAVYESHTSDHLSEILQGAGAEWKIDREIATIPVTTDNAKKRFFLKPFFHQIYDVLRTQLIWHHRREWVNHHSTTAAAVLKDKWDAPTASTQANSGCSHQVELQLWHAWRYLEQQAAVFSALTSKPLTWECGHDGVFEK